MNAVLAIVANGRRAIIVIDKEGAEINYFLLYLIDSTKTLQCPFRVGSREWSMLVHQNHAAGGVNGSIMVGMFVFLCLASQKPSERVFFVPTRTNLGVKLLNEHVKVN